MKVLANFYELKLLEICKGFFFLALYVPRQQRLENKVDFRRIRTSLNNEARQTGRDEGEVTAVIEVLATLLELCGEASSARKMVFRIGQTLLQSQLRPMIWAPACPDYDHENGQYNFQGLNGGVSLLTQQHIAFLHQVIEVLPLATVTILVADQEAEDIELCRVCGKTPEEFHELVTESIMTTREAVAELGWTVEPMTAAIPDFHEQEQAIAARFLDDPTLKQRIKSETWQRAKMYYRIRLSFTHAEMEQRTVRTAAQYVMLGEYTRNNSYLICNHTTTNLSWYKDAGAAVLHNPISVY